MKTTTQEALMKATDPQSEAHMNVINRMVNESLNREKCTVVRWFESGKCRHEHVPAETVLHHCAKRSRSPRVVSISVAIPGPMATRGWRWSRDEEETNA